MYPQEYRYTKNHEWIHPEGAVVTMGITEYGQQQLGNVIFVELPKIGARLNAGEAFGAIESVKTVNDLRVPVSGEVTEINTALEDSPELINKDPHGAGWLIKLRLSDAREMASLLDNKVYQGYTSGKTA